MTDTEWVEQEDGSWMRSDRKWRVRQGEFDRWYLDAHREDGWFGFFGSFVCPADAQDWADRWSILPAPESEWKPKQPPDPQQMVHELFIALHGYSCARPESPRQAWGKALAEVTARSKALAQQRMKLQNLCLLWERTASSPIELVAVGTCIRDLREVLDETKP